MHSQNKYLLCAHSMLGILSSFKKVTMRKASLVPALKQLSVSLLKLVCIQLP